MDAVSANRLIVHAADLTCLIRSCSVLFSGAIMLELTRLRTIPDVKCARKRFCSWPAQQASTRGGKLRFANAAFLHARHTLNPPP
jgi:hypothetical protein